MRAPTLLVRASAPRRVRIDVATIVRHWRDSGRLDRGLAIVADHWNAHGASFAAVVAEASPLPGDPDLHTLSAALGPRLELYVK